MKSRGRKKIIYPDKDIKWIIEQFVETRQPNGLIAYKDVYLFAKELKDADKIDFLLSEDFWRKQDRQGRVIIDDVNRIRSAIAKSDSDYHEVVSTSNIINNLSKDTPSIKKRIIAKLKINEYGYQKLIKKYQKLLSKEQKYQEELNRWKAKCKDLEEKNKIYEQVLFQWADISSSRDLKLINTITTGKTRSKVVEKLLTDMFNENPNEAYRKINTDSVNEDNIIDLNSKTKNTIIDDLDL